MKCQDCGRNVSWEKIKIVKVISKNGLFVDRKKLCEECSKKYILKKQ